MWPPLPILEGLREDPECDDLVGVYADWLEDQDSPQAHLVRLGVELSRLRRVGTDRDHPASQEHLLCCQALDYQMQAYRLAHQAKWLGPVAGVCTEWFYTGGLLTHVTLPLFAFCERGDALLRSHPIRSVRLFDVGRNLSALGDVEEVASLRQLSFRGQKIGPVGAAALAACPRFERLLTLDLYNNAIDGLGVRSLADGPHMPRLRELLLAYNPLDDAAAQVLAAARHWPDLRRLDLAGPRLGLAGLLPLVRSPRRKALTELRADLTEAARTSPEVGELRRRFPEGFW